MNKKIFLTVFLSIVLLGFSIKIIGAQTTYTGLGVDITIGDSDVKEGDVICSGSNGYKKCTNEYDSSIYGVVDSLPSFSISEKTTSGKKTVVSTGETKIRVSSINGNIKKGDFVTSSKVAGVAQLVNKQGFVIGSALEDYNSNDKNAVGVIGIAVNIHPNNITAGTTKQNLVELLRNGISGLGVDPISALRYILASAMVLTSFAIGMIYFGRIAKTGVEAIGRNPLAGIRIQASVIFNIAIMIVVVLAGLGVAYLILAL